MSLSVRQYRADDAACWDRFCEDSLQSTLLHTRRFLSYHRDRFVDRSLLIEEEGRLIGLFPAALKPGDESSVISHPGITYGGILHQGGLRGTRMVTALTKVCQYLRAIGHARLLYKAVPFFYHRAPAQDDLYALFRLGATRSRCDLSCIVDLHYRLPVSERRRRCLKKATKAGVEIVEGRQYFAGLWNVLAANLAAKHGARPVHSLDEMLLLAERFPDHIRCICAQRAGEIEAGVVLFVTATTHHAQYIGASAAGYHVSALDRVFEHCMEIAWREGRRWFDFGISNEDQGMVLNDGLYKFKTEFGGSGAVHEFYELNLDMGETNVSM